VRRPREVRALSTLVGSHDISRGSSECAQDKRSRHGVVVQASSCSEAYAGSGKRLSFLVKWSGWDRLYATWQPANTLSRVTVATQYAVVTHKLKISKDISKRVQARVLQSQSTA